MIHPEDSYEITRGFDVYAQSVQDTIVYGDEGRVMYPALNLASEAGEVAGKIAKALRDRTPMPIEEIAKEIGDVFWCAAALAYDLGISLGDIAVGNLHKVNDRAARGVIQGSGDNR